MAIRATSKTLREPKPYPVRGNTGWTVDSGASTGTGGRAGGGADPVATRVPDSTGRAGATDGADAVVAMAGAVTAARAEAGAATTGAAGALLPEVPAPGYAGATPGEGTVPVAAVGAGTGLAASDVAAGVGPDDEAAGVTPGAGTLATAGVVTPTPARTGGGAAGRAGAGAVAEASSAVPTLTPAAALRSGARVGCTIGGGVGAGRGMGAGKVAEPFVDGLAAVVAGAVTARDSGACA
jgi:hypothetical protein